jgi:pyruvate/2-oxoglutarate/acetoin dehydrogenase E1 component
MRELTMSAAIRETLAQILREDERALLLGQDIGRYGGAFKITRGFADEFGPERVRDTPMSEAATVSVACGAALLGSRPIVEVMFMDFLTLGLDGLINVAVKWPAVYGNGFAMPLLVRCPAGGGRAYGPTHSQSFEGLLLNVPGLTLCCPATPADAGGLLLGAYAAATPTVFIEPKALYARQGPVPDRFAPLPIGQGAIVRPGQDLTLIGYGRLLHACLAAADELARQGVAAEVLDLRTLKPLDTELIVASVSRTGRALTVEESPVVGGVGGELTAVIMAGAFGALEAPVARLGAAEGPIPCSPALEARHFPTVADIVTRALALARY